jgi:hypothetical protein
MLDGAIRARVVSVPTLVGQLNLLLAVIGLPTLELGIIPFEAAAPVFPLSGFRLYDDLVIAESIVREQRLAEADDVARYEKYLELLRDTASTAPRPQRGDTAVTGEPAVICAAGMQRTQFGRKQRENTRAQARLASTRSPALTG